MNWFISTWQSILKVVDVDTKECLCQLHLEYVGEDSIDWVMIGVCIRYTTKGKGGSSSLEFQKARNKFHFLSIRSLVLIQLLGNKQKVVPEFFQFFNWHKTSGLAPANLCILSSRNPVRKQKVDCTGFHTFISK